MKNLSRRHCYWPKIDSDIEHYVKNCQECSENRNLPPKAETHHWQEPRYNFERVHMDYAGPFQNRHFLILVDAKSKWPEVRILNESPTSTATINLLQDIFASSGFPQVLVSDNATIFKSTEFEEFCKMSGISQNFIAPGNPSTNGLAERYVQILKNKLKMMAKDPMPLHWKVREILFRFRATPLKSGKSPAEIYLNRPFRTKLDAMRPNPVQKSNDISTLRHRILKVGDRVQSRHYPTKSWKYGIIIRKLGNLHYIVKLDDGYMIKRHINQLIKSEINSCGDNIKKSVSFENPVREMKIPETRRDILNFPNNNQMMIPAPAQDEQLRRSQRNCRKPLRLTDYVR
uniref:RNA-directed DNA polymerase n=2 Tax=Photinus pyralis TaxID=7054 RepID=A0A1Y1LV88_PHOPY